MKRFPYVIVFQLRLLSRTNTKSEFLFYLCYHLTMAFHVRVLMEIFSNTVKTCQRAKSECERNCCISQPIALLAYHSAVYIFSFAFRVLVVLYFCLMIWTIQDISGSISGRLGRPRWKNSVLGSEGSVALFPVI